MVKVKVIPCEGDDGQLPVKLVKDPNLVDGPRLSIKPGGLAEVCWRGWGMTRSELTHWVRDQIDDYFHALLPHADYYWRGTNNRREIELIKAGMLRPSTNHADGSREQGLSVADHLGYVTMSGYRYGYRVRGNVIGHGSDGEPILALGSLCPIDLAPRAIVDITAKEGEQFFRALRRAIEEQGWTIEHYKAATWAILVPAEDFSQYID